MEKVKVKNFISIIVVVLILFIFGCDNNQSPEAHTITGTITFYNSDGTPIDTTVIATVKLFYPAAFCDSIAEIQNDYSMVGPDINPILYTDYRLFDISVAECESDANGYFEIKDVSSGEYLLVYSAPGFGWHQRVCNVPLDNPLNLTMQKTIQVSGDLTNDTIWGPNQHVLIQDDIILLVGSSLEILENTIIEVIDSRITILGLINICGSEEEPVIITSGNHLPQIADWDRIEIFNNIQNFSYCIIQWANYGIINHGEINIFNSGFLNCNILGLEFELSTGNITSSLFYNCKTGIMFWETYEQINQPKIDKCIITESNEYGMNLVGSSPDISNSILKHNYYHIFCKNKTATTIGSNPIISNCLFKNSTNYAIEVYAYSNPAISKCEFIKNYYHIRCSRAYDLIANYNNFYDCNYVFKLYYHGGGNDTINATHNWWNTIDEEEIQVLIWDENDEPGGDDVGIVDYNDWLYSPVSDAGPPKRQ